MQQHLSITDPPIKARITIEGSVEVTTRSGNRIIQPADPRTPAHVIKGSRRELDLAMLTSAIQNAKAVWFHEGDGEGVYGTIYAHGDDIMVEVHLMTPEYRRRALAVANDLITSKQIIAGNWPEC